MIRLYDEAERMQMWESKEIDFAKMRKLSAFYSSKARSRKHTFEIL